MTSSYPTRTTGANKIDAALYDGPSQLVAAIQEDFATPINHYIALNFDTFANVVDALGGIHMYFPMEVFDAYSGLHSTTTGCTFLDGYHALQVVRARHLQIRQAGVGTNYRAWSQEGLSDLARIRRDHDFLKVLGPDARDPSPPTVGSAIVRTSRYRRGSDLASAPSLSARRGPLRWSTFRMR